MSPGEDWARPGEERVRPGERRVFWARCPSEQPGVQERKRHININLFGW